MRAVAIALLPVCSRLLEIRADSRQRYRRRRGRYRRPHSQPTPAPTPWIQITYTSVRSNVPSRRNTPARKRTSPPWNGPEHQRTKSLCLDRGRSGCPDTSKPGRTWVIGSCTTSRQRRQTPENAARSACRAVATRASTIRRSRRTEVRCPLHRAAQILLQALSLDTELTFAATPTKADHRERDAGPRASPARSNRHVREAKKKA